VSAFLCSEKHFQALADTMAFNVYSSSAPHYYATRDFSERVTGKDYAGASIAELERVIIDITNNLYNLNQLALEGRYGDSWTAGAVVCSVNPAKGLNGAAYYKALGCLRYQCSEALADDTDLYKHLCWYAGQVAEAIVCKTPEYDRAAWGLAA
jgi:hypothetical protein